MGMKGRRKNNGRKWINGTLALASLRADGWRRRWQKEPGNFVEDLIWQGRGGFGYSTYCLKFFQTLDSWI